MKLEKPRIEIRKLTETERLALEASLRARIKAHLDALPLLLGSVITIAGIGKTIAGTVARQPEILIGGEELI